MTPSRIENATFRLVTQMCYRVFPWVVTTPNNEVHLSVSIGDSIVTTVASVYRKAPFLVTLCLEDDVYKYCRIGRQRDKCSTCVGPSSRRYDGKGESIAWVLLKPQPPIGRISGT